MDRAYSRPFSFTHLISIKSSGDFLRRRFDLRGWSPWDSEDTWIGSTIIGTAYNNRVVAYIGPYH